MPKKYTLDILIETNLLSAKPVVTPMIKNICFFDNEAKAFFIRKLLKNSCT